MAQAPARPAPSAPPSVSLAAATDPQQAPAIVRRLQPRFFPVELSFDLLFAGHGDRLETPHEWMKWLPPLAATLQQLSLAAVSDDARLELASQAIRDGADPCAIDLRYGRTVLHWACLLAHPMLVGLLLQHSAAGQLEQSDNQGRTPLACVQSLRVEPGSAAVVGLLLAAGALPAALPNGGAELLYLADLDVPLAQRLLRSGVPVDGDPCRDKTPLLTACANGSWTVAAVLLDAGAGLRPGGPLRMTALHYPEMPVWLAEQLRRRGADVNARDLVGETPLMLACSAGNVPLARWLIEAGARASVTATSDEGLQAMDHATQHRAVLAAGRGRRGGMAHGMADS